MRIRQLMGLFGITILLWTVLCPPLWADSPAVPQSYAVFSPNKRFVFRMRVDPKSWDESKASGAMYAILRDGTEKALWKVSGWYSFKVFVPDGGQYLVRMGNWSSGCGASAEDLAVVFYKQGKQLKSYSTADLIRNPKAVECSISHYVWYRQIKGLSPQDPHHFSLVTLENREIVFNVTTGEIHRR